MEKETIYLIPESSEIFKLVENVMNTINSLIDETQKLEDKIENIKEEISKYKEKLKFVNTHYFEFGKQHN